MSFQYLLGYPSILLGYPSNNHTFMPSIGSLCAVSFYSFIFLPYNRSPKKWHFSVLKRILLPQFSTYRHRTGFNVKRKQVRITNYLGLPINLYLYFFFSSCSFCSKKYALFKKFPKIYSFFFQKEIIGHTYICTKCIDNFKFTISLKS